VSIPKSTVDGGELDVAVRPITGLTARVGVTYVDSRVDGTYLLANPLGGAAVNIDGNSFPNTPKWQLTSDAQYERPIMSNWSGYIGGSVSYRSSTLSFFGGNHFFELPSYALLDLRAGFERDDGKLSVQFWGHNVTNAFYTTFAQRVTDTITRTVGMPVTYGVTISAKY
jgi:outer membrane receptor protein involved in Fe transport